MPSISGYASNFAAVSYVLLWFLVVIQTYLIFALLRQIGILNLRIVPVGAKSIAAGPKLGQKAPGLNLADIRDSNRTLNVPSADRRDLMLVFMSPGCSTCKMLTPGIRALAGQTGADVLWAVISFGELSESYEYQKSNFDDRVLFCHGTGSVRDLYDVATTPYAVFMSPDATVLAAGIVNHIEHLESMIEAAEVMPDHPMETTHPLSSISTSQIASN